MVHKPFAWSFSRLKNYRNCPKKHYHVEIAKDFKEPENEQQSWGHQVHAAFDNAIARGKPMPVNMKGYQRWADRVNRLRDEGWTVRAERQMAINKEFQTAAWFGNDTWCRAVVDVSAIKGPDAMAIDWKTGKIQPDYDQLAITAQMIFAEFPEVKTVKTGYVWLADGKLQPETWIRPEMIVLWNNLLPEVKLMEEAARTMTYPPRPSGLCKNHCPVTSCPYHGRGNR